MFRERADEKQSTGRKISLGQKEKLYFNKRKGYNGSRWREISMSDSRLWWGFLSMSRFLQEVGGKLKSKAEKKRPEA